MAPEILNSTINTACFQSFKAADVYCLGLVMWEVARRTVSTNEKPVFSSQYQLPANEKAGVENQELPYYDVVPVDPSHQDMLQVILSCDWSTSRILTSDWSDDHNTDL